MQWTNECNFSGWNKSHDNSKWKVFKKQGLQTVHGNINSLISKSFANIKTLQKSKTFWIKNLRCVYDWCGDDKLSIHSCEDKTKCIFLCRDENLPGLHITYNSNNIKQYRMVEYLGCCFDGNLSGESMTMKCLRMINTKLQFLYRQNEFLNSKLRTLLQNSLIQPQFGNGCISW